MLKFLPSAFRHKVTKYQIGEVLANTFGTTKWFSIHDDRDDNLQDMVLGFDSQARMLEVGITYIGDDEIVFHAQKITSDWSERYRGEK